MVQITTIIRPETLVSIWLDIRCNRTGEDEGVKYIHDWAMDKYSSHLKYVSSKLYTSGVEISAVRKSILLRFPVNWCQKVFSNPFPPIPVCYSSGTINTAIKYQREEVKAEPVDVSDEWNLWKSVTRGFSMEVDLDQYADFLVSNNTLSEQWKEQYEQENKG